MIRHRHYQQLHPKELVFHSTNGFAPPSPYDFGGNGIVHVLDSQSVKLYVFIIATTIWFSASTDCLRFVVFSDPQIADLA